jgi:hypothetical protein
MQSDPARSLVLIVGAHSANRSSVASKLVREGSAVILCSGPPGCPLLRGSRCVLVEGADVTVMMPGTSHAPEVLSGRALCSQAARHAIHAGGNVPGRPSGVDPCVVAAAVEEALSDVRCENLMDVSK